MIIGRQAIINAEFPHEFIAHAMIKSFDLKVTLAVRAGQPPNIDKGFPVSPKPLSMKTKTCSDAQGIPLLSGFIAWNQNIYGKLDSKPIPEDGYQPVQLHVSLKEILEDAKKGHYQIKCNGNYLEFQALHPDADSKKDITFRINLTQSKPSFPSTNTSLLRPWKKDTSLEKPDFWDDNFGEFDKQLEQLFAVEHILPGAIPAPLEVAATPDGHPVTGDADILWIGIPIHFAQKKNKQYATHTLDDLSELAADYIQLKNELTHRQIDINELQDIEEDLMKFSKTAGIITPYELLLAKVVNDELIQTIPHFKNLFQHGPETSNPGEPSSLDSKILHFYKGQAVLTQNEQELVDFVLHTPGYLEEHFIPIHPKWDMSKWGKVIERQLALQHPIHIETLSSYKQHLETQKQIGEKRKRNDSPLPLTSFFKQLANVSYTPERRKVSIKAYKRKNEKNKEQTISVTQSAKKQEKLTPTKKPKK